MATKVKVIPVRSNVSTTPTKTIGRQHRMMSGLRTSLKSMMRMAIMRMTARGKLAKRYFMLRLLATFSPCQLMEYPAGS